MRVTHVITRLIVGGAQENTVASVLGLRQRPDLNVRLISGPTTGPEGSLEPALAHVPELLTILPSLVRPIHPWKDVLALAGLTRLFASERPDLVHTHSGKAGVLGRVAAKRARVPIIVHTIHGPSFGPFQSAFSNRILRAAERFAARHTSHFVTVAHAMTRQYLAAGIGCQEQFTCIRSGFDLKPFLEAKNDPAFRASLGLRPGDFVVGKIARLTSLKGHDDLLAAAPALTRACPSIRFLLVGDGPLRERLHAKARERGLQDHFVFAGLVTPSEIPCLIGIMDVVAHLSRREGLPRALPQALAAGRPIVAYDADGAGEVCLSEQTGFLVRPNDVDDLTKRLLLLAGDPALRERLGENGQRLVVKEFSLERMVQELCALYRDLSRRLSKASS